MQKIANNIQVFLAAIILVNFIILSQIYHVKFVWNSSLIVFTFLAILFFSFVVIIKKFLTKNEPSESQKIHLTILETFKDWSPLLVIIIVFENLREFTGVINPNPIDEILYHFDLKVFGVEPVLWAQRFVHPILSDIFSLFYASYFLMPLLPAFYLYLKHHKREFVEFTLALQFCFLIGHSLYILFPAGPPRFYFSTTFWQDYPPLVGQWGLFEYFHAAADTYNPVKYYASFPSMHVALSTLPLILIFRFRKVFLSFFVSPSFYIFMMTGIVLSTIYLRHHWVPDILAGIALGIVSCILAYAILKLSDSLKNYSLAKIS